MRTSAQHFLHLGRDVCARSAGAPRGRTRRSARPSCAETARSSGRRCRRRAGGREMIDRFAVEQHASPDCPKPGDDPQQRRLAASRRTEERHELAARNVEIDILDRGEFTEAMRDAVQRETVSRRARRSDSAGISCHGTSNSSRRSTGAARDSARPNRRCRSAAARDRGTAGRPARGLCPGSNQRRGT